MKLSVVDVDFVENSGQTYGFDNHTDCFLPSKSLKVGASDTALAQITPSSLASSVYFVAQSAADAGVSPSQAAASPETVTLTDTSAGESFVWAKLGSSGPYGVEAAKMRLAVYEPRHITVAVRLVHETHYDSTDAYTGAELETCLNTIVYNQAVLDASVTRLGTMRVAFDLNHDGKLDDTVWTTDEIDIIIRDCRNEDYDYNIFLVDHPLSGYDGFTHRGQRYIFVCPDRAGDLSKLTSAHELGHAAFSLEHTITDPENLMFPVGMPETPARLRKGQWDLIHQ